ncbi:hypothetical protein L211DRAFT_849651 [Terfezia boudieri ATCC MYA-4762]|uniref:Uncharacterized protein n=1 Tax=Terfezia boudieri ATCC MYA-4762 TaxID=1051890 RepID=A0A3N4LPT7_9PEZI|nr:hypothetical protein L211DRAFT_849651 [Terfezia boudieri ATCC MYA-4762]
MIRSWTLYPPVWYTYLEEEYDLDDEDIDAIRRNKVSGLDFLELTREFLRDPSGPYKLTDSPAARMKMLISMVKPGRVAREVPSDTSALHAQKKAKPGGHHHKLLKAQLLHKLLWNQGKSKRDLVVSTEPYSIPLYSEGTSGNEVYPVEYDSDLEDPDLELYDNDEEGDEGAVVMSEKSSIKGMSPSRDTFQSTKDEPETQTQSNYTKLSLRRVIAEYLQENDNHHVPADWDDILPCNANELLYCDVYVDMRPGTQC